MIRSAVTSLCAAVALALTPPVATAVPTPGGGHVAPRRVPARTTGVLVVSVDALSSRAIRMLGADRAPTLHRLIDEGASTLNARTDRERTVTLPNHTSMVTGRRVVAERGGHGVWWDDDRTSPRTVQQAAGHRVASLFSVVHSRRRHPALFVSKPKLSILKRSWSGAIDRMVIRRDNRRLVRRVRHDLVHHRRPVTFVHLSLPDIVGHAHGFLSRPYLRAVRRTDHRIGSLLATIEDHRRLRRHTTVIVTSDHGGEGSGHADPTRLVDYRIPFLVWGVGVARGANLYDLNPDYRDPRKRRTRYGTARPPVRNGDVANLTTDLLGLPAVPHSEFDADQSLDVR